MRYISLISLLVISFVLDANARPISYPEGWTVMQTNDWEKNRLHVHYSPNIKNSIGVVLEDELESDRFNISMQWNKLLYRKNTKTSQANLYLKTEAGVAFKGNDKEPNASIGIAGDWETRRWFTSYEANARWADEFDDGSFHQKARVGVAPYVADYGSLHTWIMLQVEHHPEELDKDFQLIYTPMVRLFKGDYLGEFGVSSNGDVMFNWIVRF